MYLMASTRRPEGLKQLSDRSPAGSGANRATQGGRECKTGLLFW